MLWDNVSILYLAQFFPLDLALFILVWQLLLWWLPNGSYLVPSILLHLLVVGITLRNSFPFFLIYLFIYFHISMDSCLCLFYVLLFIFMLKLSQIEPWGAPSADSCVLLLLTPPFAGVEGGVLPYCFMQQDVPGFSCTVHVSVLDLVTSPKKLWLFLVDNSI